MNVDAIPGSTKVGVEGLANIIKRGELMRYENKVAVDKTGARQELSCIDRWKRHPLVLRALASLRSVKLA